MIRFVLMLKIYSLSLLMFIAIIVPAQNNFSALKRNIEQKILYSQHREALELINNQRQNYTTSYRNELDVLKLECINELGLTDEAFALSQIVLEEPTLSPQLKLRTHLQRALIYEVGLNAKNCKRELHVADNIFREHPSLKPHCYTYFLIRKGSYHRMFGKKEEAIKLAREAEANAALMDDKKHGAVMNMFLGLTLDDQPKYVEKHFQKALQLYKEYGNISGIAAMYNNLTKFYLEHKNPQLAEQYVDSAIAIVPKVEIYSLNANAYQLKSQIAENQNRYAEALKNYKLANEWIQKNTEEFREIKVKELELMYNTESQKMRQAELQTNMTTTKRWNNMLILCTVTLILFAAILIYFLRMISKNKQRIEIQKQSIFEKNEVLKKNVEEKQFLVRELNHRVKNNLSVILSLVRFQRDETGDEKYRNKFEQLYSRIKTISLAHHLFSYSMNNFENSLINTTTFTQNIIKSQEAGYPHEISVETKIEEFSLPVDQGLPYGLILNELFTNSLKHAVPPSTEPLKITVNLLQKEDHVLMEYCDNGTSFFQKENHKSLGRFLIDTMVEQLNGECSREQSLYRVVFPLVK